MADEWEDYVPPRERTRQIKEAGKQRFRDCHKQFQNNVADWGRQAVYDRERRAWYHLNPLKVEMSIEELQEKANEIFADERVKKIDPFPGEEVHVEATWKRGAVARAYERRIRFGELHDNFTLFHEAAHLLCPSDQHGEKFQKAYVLLFTWFLGKEAGITLGKNLGLREFVLM